MRVSRFGSFYASENVNAEIYAAATGSSRAERQRQSSGGSRGAEHATRNWTIGAAAVAVAAVAAAAVERVTNLTLS